MKNFNKAVYDLLGAAVCMVLLPVIVGFAFYVYAHKGENPAAGPVLQLLAVVAIAAIAGAVLQWRAATLQLELMLCNERTTTKTQAEQFGGDPLDDPELEVGGLTWPRDAFAKGPHPQMFFDMAKDLWRFLPGSRMKRSELMGISAQANYARLLRESASTYKPKTARERDNLSASEALFGFMSWLTTRPGTLEIGARHEAPQFAVLVAMFIEAQGLSDPAEDWAQRLVPMGDRDVRFSRVEYSPESTFGTTPPIQLTDCAPTFGVQPFSLGESLEEDLAADDLLPVPLELVPAGDPPAPYYVPTINRAPIRGEAGACFDADGQPWHEPGSCPKCAVSLAPEYVPIDEPIDDPADLEAVDQALLRKRGGAE